MSLERAIEPISSRPSLGHRPALDGIRGLAIGLVVASHTTGFPPTAFTGVELFFVLSGFLITTLLLEEHARRGRVSLRDFYRRRALRLLPALAVLLAAFLLYSVVDVLAQGGSVERPLFGVAAGLGYFTNIALTVDPAAIPSELRHLWSLAIEEQFYVVWPPVLFLVLRGRARLALGFLAAACLFGLLQQLRLYQEGAPDERIQFGTDTRSTSILIGCMVALALVTSTRWPPDALARRVAPLGIACFLSLLLVSPSLRVFSAWVLLFALSCACLVLLALDGESRYGRVLSVAPMVFLGRISYSLYLWHVAIYWAFGLSTEPELLDVPALALSFGCALASYYLVELPFLRRKRTHHDRPAPESPAAVPALSPAGS